MPFEVTCGQCHGALLVEHPGVVVECPSCGAHLDIPADAELTEVDHPESEPAAMDQEHLPAGVLPAQEIDVPPGDAPIPVTEAIISHSSPALNELASVMESVAEPTANDAPVAPPAPELPADSTSTTDPAIPVTPALDEAVAADPEKTVVVEGTAPIVTAQEPATVVLDDVAAEALTEVAAQRAVETSAPAPMASFSATGAVAGAPVAEQTLQIDIPAPPPREVVSKQLFFYVASYASALTLVVIYLLYSVFTYRAHVLESLPDIEPPMKDGKIGMKTAKPQDDVPRGHVLRLGESQRFGNVLVTPTRVTRGPVTFEHLFGDRKMTRDASPPVYKLWLKFENVSADQAFAPLSTPLVYKRYASGMGNYKTNNFLVAEADRMKKSPDLYYLFGLPENSEFAIAGQKLNTVLGPGETLETFLPAEDSLDAVTGEWTWRVYFRKGYNPRSHRGVTTVIDVRFDGDAVTTDTTTA